MYSDIIAFATLTLYFRLSFFQLRLAKYADYSSVEKLQGMLGDLESKVHQAEGQGPARNVSEQLAALSSKFSTAGEFTNWVQPWRKARNNYVCDYHTNDYHKNWSL